MSKEKAKVEAKVEPKVGPKVEKQSFFQKYKLYIILSSLFAIVLGFFVTGLLVNTYTEADYHKDVDKYVSSVGDVYLSHTTGVVLGIMFMVIAIPSAIFIMVKYWSKISSANEVFKKFAFIAVILEFLIIYALVAIPMAGAISGGLLL